MLIPPFLMLEPVKMVHHLSEGRSMFGLVRAEGSGTVDQIDDTFAIHGELLGLEIVL